MARYSPCTSIFCRRSCLFIWFWTARDPAQVIGFAFRERYKNALVRSGTLRVSICVPDKYVHVARIRFHS